MINATDAHDGTRGGVGTSVGMKTATRSKAKAKASARSGMNRASSRSTSGSTGRTRDGTLGERVQKGVPSLMTLHGQAPREEELVDGDLVRTLVVFA
jgi:hypothetical protein